MSWIECYLEEVASISSGFAFKSNEMSVESGTPVIKIKNINDRKVYKKTDTYLPSKFYNVKYDKYILKEGDILVAMTGQGSVGRIGKMSNVDREYLINQRVGIIKAKEKICDNEFLFQLIATPENEKKYFNLAQGAGQPNLSPKDIGALEISIPTSLETQKRIASILSAYDDLIENNLKRIKLLEETAQNIYKEWFVNFHFPNYENTPFNQETGLPENWEMNRLSDLVVLTMGQSPESEFYNVLKEGLPFHQGVTGYGHRFVSHSTYCTKITRVAEEGDILFSVRAPVGRLNIAPERLIIGRGLSAIKNKNGLQSFQFYQLKEHFFQEDLIGSGSIFNSVTKSDLANQLLVSPKLSIQESFEKLINPIDAQIWKINVQNQKLKEARDILLPRLMNRTIEV